VRIRGLLWGPVVHVPLGGSTEGALPSRSPARHRVGRTRTQERGCAAGGGEGTAHRDGFDSVSCARGGGLQASSSASGLSDMLVGDMTYGLELGGCALRPPPREENPSRGKTLRFDGGGGRYGGGSAAQCGVMMGVESAMDDAEGVQMRWEWGILP
jgi:hypothetical protein